MPENYKKASWLELFYDVAYIALVAQLTYLASENYSTPADIINIVLIGYSIFIAWWATTANRNLEDQETAVDKLFVQLQMVGAFLMSVTMGGVFEGDYELFFATLAGVRVLQSFMLGRMYYQHPRVRPKTYNILGGYAVASALWLASAFVPTPYHLLLALMALVVDIMAPITHAPGNQTRYLNVYHLQERLGLFLMLVIGEAMIVVALANTSSTALSFSEPTVLFSGLGLMVALWWLYFDHSEQYSGVRPKSLFVFLHSHALLFGSIILVSVAYKLILELADPAVSLTFLLLGSGGIATALLIIRGMLHSVHKRAIWWLVGLIFFGMATAALGVLFVNELQVVILVTVTFAYVAILDRLQVFAAKDTDDLTH